MISHVDDHHLWLPYTQMKTAPAPLRVMRTEGARIFLENGQSLVDGVASWWTACHGYNHPVIAARVARQLETMPHVMLGGLVHRPALDLSAQLASLLPGDLNRVFFTESGSVSVEVALKIAIQFWRNKGRPGKTKILSFYGGYHGDTLGTMAICDPEEGMHALFTDVLATQPVAHLPDTEAKAQMLERFLEAQHAKIAALIVEPMVQGAGGMVFHDAGVLRQLRQLADRYDVLLIFDEVFTGFGRIGAMFACGHAGVTPDIVTLSKALTGGTMALAATVAREGVFEAFLSDKGSHALMHGPTFMGNPLACAAACASLELFQREPRLAQVAAIETCLREGLTPCRGLPGVKDVRVLGAIGVVELEVIEDMTRLKQALIAEGVWIRPFRNIIYVTPAFILTADEIKVLTSAIYQVVAQGAFLRKTLS